MPARLDHVATLRDHLGEQADARAVLAHPPPVAGRDQPPLQRVEVDARHLCDLGTHATRDLVDLAEPADLGRRVDLGHGSLRPIRPGADAFGQIDDRPGCISREGGAGGGRGLQERVAIQAVGVRIPVGGAAAHPYPRPPIEPRRQLLDTPVVEPDRGGCALLDEHLGEVPAVTTGGREHVGDEITVEHGGDGNSGR